MSRVVPRQTGGGRGHAINAEGACWWVLPGVRTCAPLEGVEGGWLYWEQAGLEGFEAAKYPLFPPLHTRSLCPVHGVRTQEPQQVHKDIR